MSLVRGLFDRLLLICAVVAGGLVPGFIAQYRQRLGGRLDQAQLDLAPWQKIADRYFHGDLGKLIQYHLASKDPTFHSEGSAIQTLLTSVQHLQAEAAALHGSLFQQAGYLALHADPGIARATLADWVPTFGLSAEGIVFALAFAAIVWLLFQSTWSITASGGRRLATRLRRPPPLPAERTAGAAAGRRPK
ncbi:MAG: DUF2937 family protein [Steroidobacteraceae bacterium]